MEEHLIPIHETLEERLWSELNFRESDSRSILKIIDSIDQKIKSFKKNYDIDETRVRDIISYICMKFEGNQYTVVSKKIKARYNIII